MRTVVVNVLLSSAFSTMSSTRQSILQALRDTRLVDPHSHINPHAPASTTLADILGYHYYTELVHSAGTPKNRIEFAGLGPRELVSRLVPGLRHLTNTAQHSWLIDICQRFFGFEEDVIDESNWEALYDSAESTMRLADWADVVLEKSNVEAVFLTNDFDDNLAGFDTQTYIPCLRTDDLVFHLSKVEVRDRLAVCTGIDLEGSLKSLRDSLEQRFEHFVSHGARACAISLPPDFSPTPVSDGRAATALDAILRLGPSADASHKAAMARRVFWTIVELCDQFNLPMDLMIGVNRGVYPEGVHQGRDLYDSRVSLIQYRELFNAFPGVKFPISVLASVTNQELVSYAWIFPNVLTNGHWWYSNTPSFIRRDAAARLEAVPRNKQIGYYSDAYKLEFIAPKFEMYRNILAGILFDDFVVSRGWTEEKAIELGQQVLRGNVDSIFPDRSSAPVATDDSEGHRVAANAAANAGSTVGGVVGIAAASLAFDGASAAEVTSLEADSPEIETWIDEAGDVPVAANTEPASDADEFLESVPEAAADEPFSETLDFEETGIDLNATIEQTDAPWLVVESEAEPEAESLDADPHATLEIEPGWSNDTIESPIETEEASANEDASASEEVDIHSTYVDEPLDFAFEDSGEPLTLPTEPSGNELHYFRADEGLQRDETVELNPIESFEDPEGADDLTNGMFADPTTGELTMPVPADDSDTELDETYLLPDEIDSESEPMGLPSSDELIDFDDLELAPMAEDDSDLLVFTEGEDGSDDADIRVEDNAVEDISIDDNQGVGFENDAPEAAEASHESTGSDEFELLDEQGATLEFDDTIDFTFDEPEDDQSKP